MLISKEARLLGDSFTSEGRPGFHCLRADGSYFVEPRGLPVFLLCHHRPSKQLVYRDMKRQKIKISASQVEACLRRYWLGEENFRVIKWRFREAEAAHLSKLYSAVVLAEIVTTAPTRYLLASLGKHSWRKPWEPCCIECGDFGAPGPREESSYINHLFLDHLPTKSEIDQFQALSEWSLSQAFRIVEETEHDTTA